MIAHLTGRPTKMRLPRMEDMTMTGKRHPSTSSTTSASTMTVCCTASRSISPVTAATRRTFPARSSTAPCSPDNAYYLGDATINGHRCKTNLASNTAYRGFGGPQGMVAIEEIMDAVARELGKDPLEVRKQLLQQDRAQRHPHYRPSSTTCSRR